MEGNLQPHALVAPQPTSPFESYVIESFKHSSAFETHVIESLKHSKEFEKYVIESFKRNEKSFKNLESSVADIIENQKFMMDQMVTHDEFEERLVDFKTEITTELKDHITNESDKVCEKLTVLIKKCDGRTDDVVVTLERKKVITSAESSNLLRTSPFTSTI